MNKALYVSSVEAGSADPRNIRVGGGQYVLAVGVYCDHPVLIYLGNNPHYLIFIMQIRSIY